MKQMFLILALIVSAFAIVSGQDKPKPEVVRLEAAAQQETAELQRQLEEASLIFELAKARKETAQGKVNAALFRAMADAGLKTKEWVIKQDQGGIYFERVKTVETAKIP